MAFAKDLANPSTETCQSQKKSNHNTARKSEVKVKPVHRTHPNSTHPDSTRPETPCEEFCGASTRPTQHRKTQTFTWRTFQKARSHTAQKETLFARELSSLYSGPHSRRRLQWMLCGHTVTKYAHVHRKNEQPKWCLSESSTSRGKAADRKEGMTIPAVLTFTT